MTKFKHFLKIALIVLFAGVLLQSCGKDDDDTGDSGDTPGSTSGNSNWAPSNVVGKIISWSEKNSDGTAGNSDVRIRFDNSTDLSTNFSDMCTYTYRKINNKTAHLNFMAPQMVVGVLRTFQYDFDMIFTSQNEFNVSGSLKVNYLSGPNAGRTYYMRFTGKGKYVTSLWNK